MKKEYYLLETDSYGQPSGMITIVNLTKEEYEEMRKQGHYIYKDYGIALERACD